MEQTTELERVHTVTTVQCNRFVAAAPDVAFVILSGCPVTAPYHARVTVLALAACPAHYARHDDTACATVTIDRFLNVRRYRQVARVHVGFESAASRPEEVGGSDYRLQTVRYLCHDP